MVNKLRLSIAALVIALGLVTVGSAQVTVPNTLPSHGTIVSADLNTNFSAIANGALNRLTGGNIAGNVTVDPGVTIDGIDIGATMCPTCSPTFKDLTLTSPATGVTVAGVNIINSSGKIPAITSSYFAALAFDAANLTGTIANAVQDVITRTGTITSGTWSGAFGAVSGANLTTLNASNLASGTVPDARFPATLPAVSGVNLTSLNGTNVASGTVADARLSANIPRLDAGSQTWTGQQTLGAVAQIIATGRSGAFISALSGAFGTGAVQGNTIHVQNNTSGNGSPGALVLYTRTGVAHYLWVDAAASLLRINQPTGPTESGGDVIGVIVGTQTSTLDTKTLLGHDLTPRDALDLLMTTPVKRFVYNNGAYNHTQFNGIIADWSPEFAMDPDEKHPNGKSFNPVSAFGYTVQSIKELQNEIDALRKEVAALKAKKR